MKYVIKLIMVVTLYVDYIKCVLSILIIDIVQKCLLNVCKE